MSIIINVNVKNITLTEVFELLTKYGYETKNKNIEFKGYNFKIEIEVSESINYFINEIENEKTNI